MVKKILLASFILGLVILTLFILSPFKQKSLPVLSPATDTQLTPSKTLKTYTDPSGFSFAYPDNLSLLNNELKDSSSYAELQLTAKGAEGSLILKISDSKFASLDEWIQKSQGKSSKEVNLGTLKAVEIITEDKILLGALDEGIFFNIEVPLSQNKDFWMAVYSKVLTDFSFVDPQAEGSSGDSASLDAITLESEEVVE